MKSDKYERLADRLIEDEQRRASKELKSKSNEFLRQKRDERVLERLEAQAQYEQYVRHNAEIEFNLSPITEVPDDVKLPTDYFDEVQKKVEYNNYYADLYMQRFENTNLEKYAVEADRVRSCHKTWIGDYYKKVRYFNAKRVFHCHNRWCWLCCHLKQANRLYEYHLKFEQLLKDYDLYHLVFTVPNVKGKVLKDTLNRMKESVYTIIRYFQGHGNFAELDFKQYGWVGAIRSFEIVISPKEYHPHLHVLFMLKKGLDFPNTEINKYSFNIGSKAVARTFSKFEITLQKIFYLLMNGKRVTMDNIRATKIGYSCMMDCVEGDRWHEVFKYATKMSKDGSSICTYEQFVLLDDILHKFKMIQGYGIFYNIKDKPEVDPTIAIMFEKVLVLLEQQEMPERDKCFELDKLVDELHKKNVTVISKKTAYKYVKTLYELLRSEMGISDDYVEPF